MILLFIILYYIILYYIILYYIILYYIILYYIILYSCAGEAARAEAAEAQVTALTVRLESAVQSSCDSHSQQADLAEVLTEAGPTVAGLVGALSRELALRLRMEDELVGRKLELARAKEQLERLADDHAALTIQLADMEEKSCGHGNSQEHPAQPRSVWVDADAERQMARSSVQHAI
eukprot:SAG31_NODE_1311_length_8869_cov_10.603535_4_plen_177_part_00